MGVMNLLKANWTGKVGQTVGAKWKDKSTIRTYSVPAYTDTPAQHNIRNAFGKISQMLSVFTLQLKAYSALDTRSMSLRNALIKLNKDMIENNHVDPENLKLSKGGLPNPGTITTSLDRPTGKMTVTWVKGTSPVISEKAKMIVVIAEHEGMSTGNVFRAGWVGTELYSKQTITVTTALNSSNEFYVYAYILDYRGSAKVASESVAVMV
jgi:transposase-like protein